MGTLWKSLKHGGLEELERLLEKGLGVNAGDRHGATYLYWASLHGLSDVVKLLLAHGADVNATRKDGTNAMEDGSSVLHSAVATGTGNVETLEVLLAHAADPNVADRYGNSSLHSASSNGRSPALVQVLMEYGADANAIGHSPLHSASYFADERKVELLLAHGADVNAEDHAGKTPLHWAAQNGHVDMVKLLLGQGAEKGATIWGGMTALHFAAHHGQQRMVEMLMGLGMDPNQKDKYGYTALHLAASYHDIPTVMTLLNGGCNPNITNEFGETPLSLCVQQRPSISDCVAVLSTACLLMLHGAVYNNASGPSRNRTRRNRSEAAIVAACVHHWASEPHSRLGEMLRELLENGMAAARAYLTEKQATRERNPEHPCSLQYMFLLNHLHHFTSGSHNLSSCSTNDIKMWAIAII